MPDPGDLLSRCTAEATDRVDLWSRFVAGAGVRRMVEIGVFRGEFAERMLNAAGSIETYYLLDPWRHLDDWEKPANADDATFERYLEEARARTAFAGQRRVFLRGTTTEVIDEIDDASLDFAYIDGDHTLRGITVDLVRVLPKIRPGGFLAGDDFSPTIWQHTTDFEPTLVFPFAVHFAEAIGARIHAVPHGQFLIEVGPGAGFSFEDHTGRYPDTGLRQQMKPGRVLRRDIARRVRRWRRRVLGR